MRLTPESLRHDRTVRFPAFFILSLLSSLYGLLLINSAVRNLSGNFMRNQLIAFFIGTGLFFAACFFDPDRFLKLWPILAAINLAFIGSLYFFGVGDSNKSWLRIGSVGVQPAEVGKLLFILTFSAHIDSAKRRGFRFFDITGLMLHAAVTTAAVIFISRDDGMSLSFIFICIFMLYCAGLKRSLFFAGTIVVSAASPFIWRRVMDEYQRSRILAVLRPEEYPDVAYQAMHSRTAISQGRLFGMGYMQGSLTQRNLIPTKHTDSIIAVAGEELGAFGCIFVILLLGSLIFLCLRTAAECRSTCPRMICTGVAGMLIFQTVLNIGMNLGLLPMVGLTLPFFSYGGSSLVTTFAAAGLAAGINRRSRNEIKKILNKWRTQ